MRADDRLIRSEPSSGWLSRFHFTATSCLANCSPQVLASRGFAFPSLGRRASLSPRLWRPPFRSRQSRADPMMTRLAMTACSGTGIEAQILITDENRGLRYAMEQGLPLAYFHGIVPGRYWSTWPVFIVADDPRSLTVTVNVEASQSTLLPGILSDVPESDTFRRTYAAAQVRVRLHQRSFRERVLNAYRRQCAFCRLRHDELLEAAHIVSEIRHPLGEPAVANGLALCALHHSVFDRQFVGLRPYCVIEVRPGHSPGARRSPPLLTLFKGCTEVALCSPARSRSGRTPRYSNTVTIVSAKLRSLLPDCAAAPGYSAYSHRSDSAQRAFFTAPAAAWGLRTPFTMT